MTKLSFVLGDCITKNVKKIFTIGPRLHLQNSRSPVFSFKTCTNELNARDASSGSASSEIKFDIVKMIEKIDKFL